jgi:hypothetical protein
MANEYDAIEKPGAFYTVECKGYHSRSNLSYSMAVNYQRIMEQSGHVAIIRTW